MKLCYFLTPDSEAYQETLLDIFRIFAPDFHWSQAADAQPVTVERAAQVWTLCLGAQRLSFAVVGLDENQRRRQLKAQAYQFLQAKTGYSQHPWGLMTGVRPTKTVHRERDAGRSEMEIDRSLRQDYFVQPEKAALLLAVTRRQRPFLPSREQAKQTVSVYLSIPFCPTRCAYCSFPAFALPKPALQERYLDDLLTECQVVGEALRQHGKVIQTLYIGGGTPTSLSFTQLDRLLNGVQHAFLLDQLQEFTVEAGRPDTITEQKLQLLRDYQVGRVSINPQSFSQRTLDAIGRKHTVEQVLEAYQLARQIDFDSVNMDLIVGLTGESLAEFQNSLAQVAALQPENLTVHTLAIKRTAALQLGDFSSPQAEMVRAMHHVLGQWLQGQPYVPYYLYRQKHMVGDQENVGYCLPGKESLYNILMMEERQTILGLGVGAASKYVNPVDWTLKQRSNPKDLIYYHERLDTLAAEKAMRIGQMGS